MNTSLGRGTIAVVIARREVPIVPIGWVVLLTPRERVNLQMGLDLITS